MNPQRSSLNPCSIKSRFTHVFLRALMRIHRKPKRPSLNSSREIRVRYRRIRIAAYASMASAVGSRRAWSRAMFSKIRKYQQPGRHRGRMFRAKTNMHGAMRRRRRTRGGFGGANELRKLVPGCEDMDLCRLLGETEHYIKCLTTQVEVMRKIAGVYPT